MASVMSGSRVDLYYTNGRSNKVYIVQVEQVEGGNLFQAVAYYGRQGSSPRRHVLCTPTSSLAAYSVGRKQLEAKKCQGYSESSYPLVNALPIGGSADTVELPQPQGKAGKRKLDLILPLSVEECWAW